MEEVARSQNLKLIVLEGAAVAVKDQKGKDKVKQTLEKMHTGSAATWGLFGALMGAIMGKTTDLGIDNKFIKEVGDSLDPGGSALFLLVIEATTDKVFPELSKLGGEVYQTSLSYEDEETLKKALDHDQIKAAAGDSLELE